MNDTLSIKALKLDTLDSANFDAANTRSFPRVTAYNESSLRRDFKLGSLSPTEIRIQSVPRSTKNAIQRTVCSFDQKLTRLDTEDNPIGETRFSNALQSNIPSDVTEDEYVALWMLAMGAALENNAALLRSMYNAEY